MLKIGHKVFSAFQQPHPLELAQLATETEVPGLMRNAIKRQLHELPARGSGLSHTQTIVLEKLRSGPVTGVELFRHYLDVDRLASLGDLMFEAELGLLLRATTAAIQVTAPPPQASDRGFLWNSFELTQDGRSMLDGVLSFLDSQPPGHPDNRWVGGTEVTNAVSWRRSPKSGRIFSTK